MRRRNTKYNILLYCFKLKIMSDSKKNKEKSYEFLKYYPNN